MPSHTPRIQPTGLNYQDIHTPVSPVYGDVYFVAEQGIEESTYIYLEGTRLRERLTSASEKPLQLLEIGFGVGLNFLLTLREFALNAHPTQTLLYYSVERQPVFEKDLRELYARFPEIESYAQTLLDQYPILTPGFHTLSFLDGRVKLILMLGEAHEMLSRLDARFEVMYLDGFSPSRNPDAFSEILFQQIARLAAKNAVGASFTAAGWVRRSMEALGFRIEKRDGFSRKRECIRIFYERESNQSTLPPWFSNANLTLLEKGDRVAVVGAGLSGSAIARELAERGFAITVFDANGIANRASGNSVGLYNIQLSKLPNPISRYSQLALTHFLRELKTLPVKTRLGIFRVDEATETALQTSEYPEDFYVKTTRDEQEGFYFPYCGILNPRALCVTRLQHSLIEFREEAAILETLREFDHVVYAMGADLVLGHQPLHHPELNVLPLRPIRGQTIEVKPTLASQLIQETWVNSGYLSPIAPEITGHEYHLIGATYQAKTISEEQEAIDTQKLVDEVKTNWKSFATLSEDSVVSHRVGYRLSTPDKLPIIGPLFDSEKVKNVYEHAFRGSRVDSLPALPVKAREWVLTGMGSRGITFSSLGAEILGAMMTGEPLPIELDLWEHLHSARFSIRNLKRNEVR